MATIKEQTEKTEQLKTSLDNKVIAIAEEIKKQDDINITRLSEVPNAIARLKKSRKRWATGESGVSNQGVDAYLNIRNMNLNFTPKYIFWVVECLLIGYPASGDPNLLGGMVEKMYTHHTLRDSTRDQVMEFKAVESDELKILTSQRFDIKKMYWIAFE